MSLWPTCCSLLLLLGIFYKGFCSRNSWSCLISKKSRGKVFCLLNSEDFPIYLSGTRISVYVCKKVYLLWYLSYKFCVIALHGDETLLVCIIVCSLDVGDCATVRWTSVQSRLGHWNRWRIWSRGKHRHCVVLTNVRGILGGWLWQHLASPHQSRPGLLEAREGQPSACGHDTFEELKFYPGLQGFIALQWYCLAKKMICLSCTISDAPLVLTISQGLIDCAAVELQPRGWAESAGALTPQELWERQLFPLV